MTQIPAGTKFHGVAASVDTRDKKSARRNALHEAYSIEDIQLSLNNFDFTDTISYVTEEDYSITYGDGASFSGSVMGSKITKDDHSLIEAIGDGNFTIPGGSFTFPQQFSGQSLSITSGSASGSFMLNQISKDDIGGEATSFLDQRVTEVIDQESGDTISFRDRMSIDGDGNSSFSISKVIGNESVDLRLSNSETGFNLQNTLSDNSASVLRIENNNSAAILEFFNDYLVSETIPSLDYADDTAAEAGGVPPGGIYHNSGSIRIRLSGFDELGGGAPPPPDGGGAPPPIP